jgi:anti-anti-sigma regulatory factor
MINIVYHWSHYYGNVIFAGANRMEELLPNAKNSQRAVAILRMREHSQISSTFIKVLERYEAQLREGGGKLILAGISQHVKGQLDRTE